MYFTLTHCIHDFTLPSTQKIVTISFSLTKTWKPSPDLTRQHGSTCTCHISGHAWVLVGQHSSRLSWLVFVILCSLPDTFPCPTHTCTGTVPDGAGPPGAPSVSELEAS